MSSNWRSKTKLPPCDFSQLLLKTNDWNQKFNHWCTATSKSKDSVTNSRRLARSLPNSSASIKTSSTWSSVRSAGFVSNCRICSRSSNKDCRSKVKNTNQNLAVSQIMPKEQYCRSDNSFKLWKKPFWTQSSKSKSNCRYWSRQPFKRSGRSWVNLSNRI